MTADHTPAPPNPGLPKLRFVRLLKAKSSWVDLPTFFLFVITGLAVAASARFHCPVAIGGWLLLGIGTWALSVAVIPSSDVLKSGSALRGAAFVICLAICISVPATSWPMRLVFLVSRSHCERLATQLEAGEQVALPRWAGLYYVRDAGLNRNGVAYLWSTNRLSGSDGIVHCRKDQVEENFNEFLTFELSSDWQYVSED